MDCEGVFKGGKCYCFIILFNWEKNINYDCFWICNLFVYNESLMLLRSIFLELD